MKKLLTLFIFSAFSVILSAQASYTGSALTIDFSSTLAGVNEGTYDGSGLAAMPMAGQLDADAWTFSGISGGGLTRGNTDGLGETSHGLYAYAVNPAIWVQPTSSTFTPGSVTLEVINNTGSVMNSISISYDILFLNDTDRSSSFNFSWSTDDVSYTSVGGLDYATPTTLDDLGVQSLSRSTTITFGTAVANGNSFYIRWSSDDIGSGSNPRDEIGLDNITMNACGITSLGSPIYDCTTSTVGDDNDALTVLVPYVGLQSGVTLEIIKDDLVTTTPNIGEDPTSTRTDTIKFAANEGENWTVNISGGSCTYSESIAIASDACDPAADIIINEVFPNPARNSDANGDGVSNTSQDEFVEIFNKGTAAIDISGWTIRDASSNPIRHTFPMGTVLSAQDGIIVFGGGTPTGFTIQTQVANPGSLQLNDTGDNVQLFDNASTPNLIDNFFYISAEDGTSYGRNPDFTGSFVLHSNIQSNPIDFSPGLFNATNMALPIELVHFHALPKTSEVLLTWTTASETNNHYMAVERSTDGRQFTEIGRVMGAGTTNIPQSYSFTDEVPGRGLNYYRLRQVDFDGAMEYSEVVVVEFQTTQGGLTVAPTDATDWVSVGLEGGFPERGQLQVFDLNGRLLHQVPVEAGMPNTEIDVRNLATGQYLVRLVSEDRLETQRFFKR